MVQPGGAAVVVSTLDRNTDLAHMGGCSSCANLLHDTPGVMMLMVGYSDLRCRCDGTVCRRVSCCTDHCMGGGQ